jgi:hypothetical protein
MLGAGPLMGRYGLTSTLVRLIEGLEHFHTQPKGG